jgi:hypothetical protein
LKFISWIMSWRSGFLTSIEGIVRFSTEKYDVNAISNIFAHLTNTSINKHSPSYTTDKEYIGPGCKWTLTQLRHFFHQNHINDNILWIRILNIVDVFVRWANILDMALTSYFSVLNLTIPSSYKYIVNGWKEGTAT